MTLGISIYFGVFFISDNFDNNGLGKKKDILDFCIDSSHMSDESKLFMFTVIVLSHTFFFCYWVQCFFKEFKFTIRQRYPSLYTMVFLCCKNSRLIQELDKDQARDKLKPFLRKYDELLDCKDLLSNFTQLYSFEREKNGLLIGVNPYGRQRTKGKTLHN
ncbi:hypothetical protein FGO68_gene13542 [Halteria grandinella]|uniref:Uncharacterized protein n=1 Tax=Halteria grandinella TaxID=5974 RepID=A0A8J8NHS7_HALGN|nr:hypothetical protein FGO68_gene13542 [Halteria grandinella]